MDEHSFHLVILAWSCLSWLFQLLQLALLKVSAFSGSRCTQHPRCFRSSPRAIPLAPSAPPPPTHNLLRLPGSLSIRQIF